MRVFLTGATGFIGVPTAARLAQRGHDLRCLVRPTSDVGRLRHLDGARLVTGHTADKGALREGIRGCDCLIHLAAAYSFWEADRRLYQSANVEGTRNVMEAALEAGVPRVVHVSSAAVYGRPQDRPFTEGSAPGPVRFTEYARTKFAADQIVWQLHADRGLPVHVLYPGMVLGAGERGPVGQYLRDVTQHRVPALLYPDSVFTAVYVGDVADAIVGAAEQEGPPGERYLVGKYAVSWREFTELAARSAGVAPPRRSTPDPLVPSLAALLTGLAALTRRPPLLGISSEAMRHLRAGLFFDGSKAERLLGVVYTPIPAAVEEAVAHLKGARAEP